MTPSFMLLELGLLAAAPNFISSVEAVRDGGRLAITINSDAMLDPEAASAKMVDGRLFLYVRDARVREANRAWGEGASEIRAHRHRREVELDVPLGRCQGAVELEKVPAGLRAYVSCDGQAAARATLASTVGRGAAASERPATDAKAEAKTEAKVQAKAEAKAEVKPAAQVAAATPAPAPARIVEPAVQDAVALKAQLILQPPENAEARPAAEKPAQKTTAPAKAAPLAAAIVATDLSSTRDAKGAAQARDDRDGKSSGGGGMLLAGVLLAGLAFAAFHFTRRRAKSSRFIEIIETASLGPKRAIVVARVGDATMVLGSSEAGITLLKALPEPGAAAERRATLRAASAVPAGAAAAAASAGDTDGTRAEEASVPAAPVIDDIPIEELGLDDQAPGHQGLMARLFRRGDRAPDPGVDSFDDLLEDSLEDQELRRKLSLGMAGRTR